MDVGFAESIEHDYAMAGGSTRFLTVLAKSTDCFGNRGAQCIKSSGAAVVIPRHS